MIRSIARIKLPILIQDIQVVIEANISQWKVEHYDIELTCPLQSAFWCTRQYHLVRKVTLISKLAYCIYLSSFESYFLLGYFYARKIMDIFETISFKRKTWRIRHEQLKHFVKKSGTTNSNQRILSLFV